MFPNAKTVGNGATLCLHVIFKNLDISNAIVLIRPNIIVSLDGIAKQISRQIPLILKLNRANLIPTHSNALTAKVITKLIPILAYFSTIDLTRNSIPRNIKNFTIAGTNQLAQL